MATGFDGAAKVIQGITTGEQAGLELAMKEAQLRQIGLQELENALLQPTRLASQIAKGRQDINTVRDEVINPPTPKIGGGQDKLTSETSKVLSENELQDALAKKYGEGNFERAKAFLKAKKPDEINSLVKDAVDSYRTIKSGRAPQSVSNDPVAAAIANSRLAPGEDPALTAAAINGPVGVSQIGMDQLRLMPMMPPMVQDIPPSVITAEALQPLNPFSIEGQMQALKPALQNTISNAELELLKAEQQNEFMANKILADHAVKKQIADQDNATKIAVAQGEREDNADKTNLDATLKLIGYAISANRPVRTGSRPQKDPMFDVVKNKIAKFDDFYRKQGRRRDEDGKVLRELVGVLRSAKQVPELHNMMLEQYGTAIQNAQRILPSEFKDMGVVKPGKVSTVFGNPDKGRVQAAIRAKAKAGKFANESYKSLHKSLTSRGFSEEEAAAEVAKYKHLFKDGK
jgi:hypothetical protein